VDSLTSALIHTALAQSPPAAQIYIGYSGGVDSHVLLHLCASINALRPKITAIYVHHGLQPEADDWAKHCQQTAQTLGVGFKVLRVNAHPNKGESPEEAARNARYTALKTVLAKDDVLLITQHREDQLETVLLQLFRGSGLRGLSGMPARKVFGAGFLLRPLLAIAKQAIDNYAQNYLLTWIEDASNQCNAYDRNFLRNDIVPLLKQRWPALDKTVARTAGHCAEAENLLDKVARQLMSNVIGTQFNLLIISRLLSHSDLEQRIIIRHWLHRLGFKMPAVAMIERLQSEILIARNDAAPTITTQQYSLRRYQDNLYCLRHGTATLLTGQWPHEQPSIAITDQRRLICIASSCDLSKERWQHAQIEIRGRQGGEKIRLPYRLGHHNLKKLFQEAFIPPWERALIPLISLDNQLAAVGGYWISAEFYREEADCFIFSVQDFFEI
jgi:tRNA(Ile)-lysidine synthase